MTPAQTIRLGVSLDVKASQKRRAVIYARVSVDDVRKGKMTPEELAEAASLSVRAQLAEGRRLAKAKRLDVVAELVDDGVSGFKVKGKRQREAYGVLIGMIERGEVDVLVVRHADRAGRNDAQNSAVRMASVKAGVSWYLTSGTELDLTRSGDKLNLQVQQAIAEYQSAVKSEALLNIYGQMRAEGRLRATTKTFGWQWERGKPERSMLAEPVERDAIRKAYCDLLGIDNAELATLEGVERRAGVSLYSIIRAWNASDAIQVVGRRSAKTGRNAERWSYASVRAVLLRPSNAGYVSDGAGGWLTSADKDGKPIRGQWETLVSEAVYLAARALLTDNKRRTAPGRKSAYLASGIARCGVCGSPLRSSTIKGKGDEPRRVPIYRCVTKLSFVADPGVRHVSARIAPLDKAVRDAAVAAFAFGPAELFPESTPDVTNALYTELERVEAAIREIGLALEDGATWADLGPNMKRQRERKRELLGALGEAAASEAQSAMLSDIRRGIHKPGSVDVEAFAEYRAELGLRFDALVLEQRRELVRALLDVTVLPLAPKVYGPRRWRIVHKVVTSLNDAE